MSVLFNLVKGLFSDKRETNGIEAAPTIPYVGPMAAQAGTHEAPVIIRFIVATRERREDFFAQTALGRSLSLYNFPFVELHLQDENCLGLPAVYNQAIEASRSSPAILVFAHDDVHLCDFYWPTHILNSLEQFQLVGLAGNKRRVPNQPSWAFIDTDGSWDSQENLSGTLGHGDGFPPRTLVRYGASCAEVKLLDGLMMIANSQTLVQSGLRFDETFQFHFYDMDICREAEIKGIKMGTWAISVIHESGGDFRSESWHTEYKKYLGKWGS